MTKRFKPYQPDQLLLLPPDLQDWVPEDHLVRFLSDVVDTLDLGDIERRYREPTGQPPYHQAMLVTEPCPLEPDAAMTETMRHKLRTSAGKAVYKMRKALPEPVFGQIKAVRGFRRFSFRGLATVTHEWDLICLTHNLLRLFRSGAQWRPA